MMKMVEIGGFYFNPRHVSAVYKVNRQYDPTCVRVQLCNGNKFDVTTNVSKLKSIVKQIEDATRPNNA